MMAIVVGLSLLMNGNKKGSKTFIFAATIAMFIIMAFRDAYSIGIDSASSYISSFNKIASGNTQLIDKGENSLFYYLMKVVSDLSGGNYQTFVVVISAIVMLCTCHFVIRYSVSPIQSFCYYWGLLLYIFMFSAEKQALAMAVLLLAFDAIMDRKPIRFILLVGIATMFHFPALIFLPAYWVAKMKADRNFLLLLGIALILTLIFRDGILNLMLGAYGGDEIEATMSGQALLRTKSIIMIGIVVAALVLRIPTEEDRLYSTLLKFMGLSIIFQTFCGYNNIFERLANYYFQFAIVFIPLVFEKNTNIPSRIDSGTANAIKSFAPVIFCAYGIYRFAAYIKGYEGVYLPYIFYFNK